MKLFSKVSIALFSILFLFFSCGSEQPITNPTIILTKGVGPCDLILSDSGESRTHGNNLVTWVRGDGVKEIVNIFYKSGDMVFQVGPQRKIPVDPKSDWFGITKVVGKNDEIIEVYGIDWINQDGDSCRYDPRIIVNQ